MRKQVSGRQNTRPRDNKMPGLASKFRRFATSFPRQTTPSANRWKLPDFESAIWRNILIDPPKSGRKLRKHTCFTTNRPLARLAPDPPRARLRSPRSPQERSRSMEWAWRANGLLGGSGGNPVGLLGGSGGELDYWAVGCKTVIFPQFTSEIWGVN